MKLKNVLLLLTTTMMLTSCNLIDEILGETDNSSSSNLSSNSSNDGSLSSSIVESSNKPSDSSSDITDDSSIYDKDAYKKISLKSPDFTTRKIASKDDVTFDDLFNLGNKVTIDVDIRDEELAKLQADYETGYKSEVYHIADKVEITLTNFNNTYTWTFDQVGIRQKGNTSRDNIYQDGQIKNLNHFKLSFDETFDDEEMYGRDAIDWTNKDLERQERKDREFLGLSGLDIKWNKNYDATHIKEIYASYLYDAAGLMSQSIGLSEFNINQTDKNRTYDFGLCTLFEPASKSFIKRELKKGPYVNTSTWEEEKLGTYGVPDAKYGDFYKASYGVGNGRYGNGADLSKYSTENSRVGVGNNSGSYIPAYDRKTNTDVNYADNLLKDLTKAITDGNYSNINQLMDLKYFAISEACNYFIGNPDDLKNNNNNYTIYFRRTDGKAIIIPIDNDRCFGITKDWNPDGSGMTNVGVFSKKPVARDNMNELHSKTILASSNDCKAIYLNYVKALKVSPWLTNDTFETFYNKAYETYGNDSTRTSFGDGFDFNLNEAHGNLSFYNYINSKKNLVNLDYVIGESNNSSNNNNNNNSGSGSSTDGNYGNVYLIGSFCNWSQGNKEYPLEYKGDGVYTITFTASKVNDGVLSWKIYNGYDYNTIDWTVVDGNLELNGNGVSSAKIYDCSNGEEITITVNTLTLEVLIERGE